MGESASGQAILGLHSNGRDKIPIYSRIGTKLIVGFLIIAFITGIVGYFSLSYSQIVGEKFHLLVQQSIPTIDSLKEMKLAALNIEADVNELTIAAVPQKVLQDLTVQKNKFNEHLKNYEGLVNTYFPDETELKETIHTAANTYLQTSDKLAGSIQNTVTPTPNVPPLVQKSINEKDAAEKAVFQTIDTAIANEVDEIQNRTEAVDNAIKNSSLVTFASIIVSVIVAVVFGLFFSLYISNPISNLKQASIQIGKGDYRTACKYLSKTQRSDEIGTLSFEIEKMRQSIESMKTNLDLLVMQRTEELEIKNNQLLKTEKDLRRVNEELVKTEQAKEEFMSMVSHELKTPLSPMKLYSQMLLKQTKSYGKLNEKQNKAITVILNSIMQLEVLISDILDVYKLDIGRLKINKVDVEVEELINETVTGFKPLAAENGINLQSDSRVSGSIKCDPQRIGQVLSNLIKNSLDFVPKGNGQITIRAEGDSIDDPSKVTFTVEDNGTGIPPEKIDNLFKKFYQIDTTVTRKHGGTGLGLAISKGIIEAHGGTMWLDKNYINGARFRFTLPINGEKI